MLAVANEQAAAVGERTSACGEGWGGGGGGRIGMTMTTDAARMRTSEPATLPQLVESHRGRKRQ